MVEEEEEEVEEVGGGAFEMEDNNISRWNNTKWKSEEVRWRQTETQRKKGQSREELRIQ